MVTKATSNSSSLSRIAQSQQPLAITVEVAAKPAQAKVVREGFQVPAVELNNQATDFFLENLEVIQPRQTPRVVSQSLKAGTRVTAGTVVDLVLARSSDVPLGIFQGVHSDLQFRNVDSLLDGMLAVPATRQTVLTYAKAEDVPAAERAQLTQQFEQVADIHIDENRPETSFTAAFQAARMALAFK